MKIFDVNNTETTIKINSGEKYTLPESTTQIGDVELYASSSLVLPASLTSVKSIYLYDDASISFPDGYVISAPASIPSDQANKLLIEHCPNEVRIESLLVSNIISGSELSRATFYKLTHQMGDLQLQKLQERVRSKSMKVLETTHMDMERREDNGMNFHPGDLEKDVKRVDKVLYSWFRPWTLLAGKLENALGENPNEKDVTQILRFASTMDEYKPYLQRELMGFVRNFCFDNELDYLKIGKEFRLPELEEYWLKDSPYLSESKEWDLLGLAYTMGEKGIIELSEWPCFENGYIGGKTKFSSILPLSRPVELSQGEGICTGIAQIDYKDCTNVYLLLNNNQRAISFEDVNSKDKKHILEAVFMQNKYGTKNLSAEQRREHLRAMDKLKSQNPLTPRKNNKGKDLEPKIKR